MSRFALLFIIALSPGISWAQAYNFLQFTVEEGLTNNTILSITEDQFGHLWFATQGGGLNKFDGNEFQHITMRDGLASNFVRDVICDSKGNIWAATASGISKLDGFSIKNYLYSPDDIRSVNVIEEGSHNEIWFAHPDGGVGFIEQDSITTFNSSNGFVDDVIIDILAEGDKVFILTNIHGLYRFDGEDYKNILSNHDFKGYLLSMVPGPDGDLLIGTNKGILQYNPGTPERFDNLEPSAKDYFIRSLELDASNNVWVALSNGVAKVGPKGLVKFMESEGFISSNINKIYCDREGTLWFGTDRDGIFKFCGEQFNYFGKEHGLSGESVTTIVEDQRGNLWMGTNGGGIDVLSNNKAFNLPYSLKSGYITSSCIDNNNRLWFGSSEGLMVIDSARVTSYDVDDGLINKAIRCLQVDVDNNIWIGTVNGLSVFDGSGFTSYTTSNGLSDNIIWQVLPQDNGEVHIVTRKGIDQIKNGEVKNILNAEHIFKNRLNAIKYDDQGNLWVGYSGHGITRFDAKTLEPHVYTTNSGLSSDFIYNLIWDNDGNLIVGTERGVDKIVLDENRIPEFIKNYGPIEGFKGLKTTPHAIYKQEDGAIWFGSDDGVFKYQPERSSINNVAPKTYISGLKLFYNDIDWRSEADTVSAWNHLPIDLSLSHNENHIFINYKGISLKNASEVRYQFILENLEDEWSPPTDKTEAAYTNLPPGEYVFKVRASNSDGIWSKENASFAFNIRAPFWQQYWFYGLVILILLGTFKVYYDYRLKKRVRELMMVEQIRDEEQENVRKKMARDFHDNMGNQLASITVFVNLISMKLKDRSGEVDDLLKNIEKHSKSLYTGTKDFIWSMDPASDEVHELFTHLKDFGEEFFNNADKLFYSRIVNDTKSKIKLPSGHSRQIVLIFKEAMTNVLKHSRGDKVHFELSFDQTSLTFMLKDNGSLNMDRPDGQGKGLKNMEVRANQINGKFEICKKSGYLITLQLHINQ